MLSNKFLYMQKNILDTLIRIPTQNLRGIETNMYKKTKELVELAEAFARKRDGIDETTKVLHIKLRQQVLAALGNRGFSDSITEQKYRINHEFIKIHRKLLNEEIGKYRKLKD